jgi:phosphatidate cytidylyltransferase
MSSELQKRIITSIFLLSLLTLMFLYTFVLIISLIIIAIISWVEFYALISKNFNKVNRKDKIFRFFFKAASLLYLSLLVCFIIIVKSTNAQLEIILIYGVSISIMTDIGGLIVGKIFKGKKLTKISPKKTISGAMGSFLFSIALIPLFMNSLTNYNFFILLLFTLIISFSSQAGDLFISYFKRKANVKSTSDLLPGHGGVLDRIDGIIFAIPVSFLLFINF